jgi:hypothetical protein
MNERIQILAGQAEDYADGIVDQGGEFHEAYTEKLAELILANAVELRRMMNTDPINKPFELNPKFIAKCDELGRNRRQFQ